MFRVLLIDGDEVARRAVGELLSKHRYHFAGVGTGRKGIELAGAWTPHVALVELRLPDSSGLDVLAQLAEKCPGTARIVFSGHATVEAAAKAMRVGACDYLTKPASPREIVEALQRALVKRTHHAESASGESLLAPAEPHAATRWAEPIGRLIDAPQDPRTLGEFGRAVFVSVGCFRNWCRTNRISSRTSLQFARALRAVYRFEQDPSTRPENILSIVDQRTITKFVRKCGGDGGRLPDTVGDFFARQQFIVNREAIEAVQKALAARQARTLKRPPAQEPARGPEAGDASTLVVAQPS